MKAFHHSNCTSSTSLKRTLMKDFKDIMIEMGIWNENDFNISDRVYKFYTESEIKFVSTDDPDKLRVLGP